MNVLVFLKGLLDIGAEVKLVNDKLKVEAAPGTLSADQLALLKEYKDNIIDVFLNLEIRSSKDYEFLSFSQQRLWMIEKIDSIGGQYNIPTRIMFDGEIDVEVLRRTVVSCVDRHEVLRTVYKCDPDGNPIQLVRDCNDVALDFYDISHLSGSDQDESLRETCLSEGVKPFDLSEDLMLRVGLIKLSDTKHILMLTMHHIASDGWSSGILAREMAALYSAFIANSESPLPELSLQYADYAHWQRSFLDGENLDRLLEYWRGELSGIPTVHNLPMDRPRKANPDYQGAVHRQVIGDCLLRKLNDLAQKNGATLFMVLHSAFSVLMSRYSGETDIVVGSPIANRENKELTGLIGFFVNTLVLRQDLSGSPTFNDLLGQSKRRLLGAYEHQQLPFEKLVEELQPPRSPSHSPLFQVMLSLENNSEVRVELPGVTMRRLELDGSVAKFELLLDMVESNSNLVINWSYATALFDPETISRMAEHFEVLLNELVQSPDVSVFSLDMLSKQERDKIVFEWNDTGVDYPQDKCLHELFVGRVVDQPEAVALIDESGSQTYIQLFQAANKVACELVELGVTAEDLVAVRLPKGRNQLIATLGIMIAGGAYLPLECEWPEDRCLGVLQRSKTRYLMIDSEDYSLDSDSLVKILIPSIIDVDQKEKLLGCARDFKPRQSAKDLAYVIFTSGSTGVPKGVAIEHASAVNTVLDINKQYCISVNDRVLAVSALSFDLSVYDFFGVLAAGGTVVFPLHSKAKDPSHWLEMVERFDVSIWNTVPISAGLLVDQLECKRRTSVAPLRTVLMSGDWISPSLPSRLWKSFPGCRTFSLGGATEGSIWSIHYPIVSDTSNLPSVPYGKPLGGQMFYILNCELQHCPVGVTGELFIGGRGVARCYYGDVEQTERQFIWHPVLEQRLYRTGDLGRYLEDGNIEFVGRIDNQLKIRGFRVELGEIEAQLARHPGIEDVVVIAREDGPGLTRLVAYFISEGVAPEGENLRRYLMDSLPDYMIPNAFIELDKLPLTANGKLDRKALPVPDLGALSSQEYAEPVDEIEEALASIWGDILQVDRVGRNDNFFELGGHSILAIRMQAKLQGMGFTVDIQDIFSSSTLKELANHIERGNVEDFVTPENLIPDACDKIEPEMLTLASLEQEAIDQIASCVVGGHGNIKDIYPLIPSQEGFLFHHTVSRKSDPYVLPELLSLENEHSFERFLEALKFIVARHDALRTVILWRKLQSPLQVVLRNVDVPVEYLDFGPEADVRSEMMALCAPELQWLELEEPPLFHLKVSFDNVTGRCFVLLQFHHLIIDHIGLEVLQNELGVYLSGRADELLDPIPYRDFVAHTLYQLDRSEASDFFAQTIGDVEEPTLLFNLSDVKGDGSGVDEVRDRVPERLAADVRKICRDMRVSPAAVFHAAWSLVVSLCSDRDDVIFGTVMSGRMHGLMGAGSMIGMSINTLPVRILINGVNARELVRQVHSTLLSLMSYEQAPLSLAQKQSALSSDVPLFNSLLNYRHSGIGDASTRLGTLDVDVLGAQERTNYPITLSVDDFEEGFGLDMQVLKQLDARRILAYFNAALRSLVSALRDSSERRAVTLPVIPSEELGKLTRDWNDTAKGFPSSSCIHELFEAQVAKSPFSPALVFSDVTLTYDELSDKAKKLANYLRDEWDVGPDNLVGICIDRSADMVVGVLGILMAGGAYVPLDPDYPFERLNYIVEDSGVSVVLTNSHLKEDLKQLSCRWLVLDAPGTLDHLDKKPRRIPSKVDLKSSSLAYVIYTSGSTGEPKGVMVEHKSVCNLLVSMGEKPGLSDGDSFLSVTTLSFDIASLEILLPLLKGARLILSSREQNADPYLLADLIDREKATVMQATPARWRSLVDSGWRGKRDLRVWCGGEALSSELSKRLLPHVSELWNLYGPTETTIWSTCHKVVLDDSRHQELIGKPIANTELYVLSHDMRQVPVGVAGELYIGGTGVTRGYWNRNELTSERFVGNPFSGEPDARMYRTGDVVRWTEAGELEYLGRNDHQVKIRGFRIELGDIEAAMLRLDGVVEALVVAREDTPGDQRLVGYYRGSGDETEAASLRGALGTYLPDYMVPIIVSVEEFPLTPNGKIDRKALPEPGFSETRTDYVAPRTETERVLCEIWREVLQIERIGITDNFFELGGHSLLALRVNAQVNTKFSIELAATDLLDLQCVRDLAECVEAKLTLQRNEILAQNDQLEEVEW